ncbi:MAG TPA: sugar phosphate isomerase/epimerase [Chloroflexi bacterium]|nr:sugar phosphate isomerase/epimerase [Chloroflexota bacterium]
MKYSISNWIYGDEPLRKTFERLKRYGYDGVELMGEPRLYRVAEIRGLCREFGLQVLSIAGMYPWPTEERDLANPDPEVRERAVKYLRECVDFALDVGAPLIIVVPSAVAKTSPVGRFESEEEWVAAAEREWNYALESVSTAAAYAEQEGVLLAVEPINRYETFLINNVDQGLRFVSEVGSRAVKLHLDTFHMNIEERDPAEAIHKAGELLVNVHIADSNRQAVGYGHTDFEAIMRALKDIDYQGALALEPLPPVPDPYIAARLMRYQHLRDLYAEECIARLRQYEKEI